MLEPTGGCSKADFGSAEHFFPVEELQILRNQKPLSGVYFSAVLGQPKRRSPLNRLQEQEF